MNFLFGFALFCYDLSGTLTTVPCFSGENMLNSYTNSAKLGNRASFEMICPALLLAFGITKIREFSE